MEMDSHWRRSYHQVAGFIHYQKEDYQGAARWVGGKRNNVGTK